MKGSILIILMIISWAKSDDVRQITWELPCKSAHDLTSCRLNRLETQMKNTNKILESELSTCKTNQRINDQNFKAINEEIRILKSQRNEDADQHHRNEREAESNTKTDKTSNCFTRSQICSVFIENHPDSIKIKWSAPNNKNGKANSTNSIVSANPIMPTSCQDLKLFGHSINGFHSVYNSEIKKIEIVYCDFKSIWEKRVGSVDIQSTRVHFYMTRKTSFTMADSVVNFDAPKLNVGNAMNATSGVFTAPVPGIYHFSFKGMKDDCCNALHLYLRLNKIAVASVFGDYYVFNHPPYIVSLQATLKLNVGDRVDIYNAGQGALVENRNSNPMPTNLHTQFSGSLLDQDLMAL